MAARDSTNLLPITQADLPAVGHFLNSNLNQRVSASSWEAAIRDSATSDWPNHGFMIQSAESIVGVYLAIYSDREIDGRTVRICNLAAWCVIEEHRSQGLRLLRAILGQRGYEFTDFSPSGNVVALNRRLKFRDLDTSADLVLNLPWPLWSGRARIVTNRIQIDRLLGGRELSIFRDHQKSAAARHFVVIQDDKLCYVMFRRDRRKNLPLFASLLYVGDAEVFRASARLIGRHLLLRHGVPATLAERRLVGASPQPAFAVRSPRPKMFRSETLEPNQVDYLYSELAWVAW